MSMYSAKPPGISQPTHATVLAMGEHYLFLFPACDTPQSVRVGLERSRSVTASWAASSKSSPPLPGGTAAVPAREHAVLALPNGRGQAPDREAGDPRLGAAGGGRVGQPVQGSPMDR